MKFPNGEWLDEMDDAWSRYWICYPIQQTLNYNHGYVSMLSQP